MLLYLVKLYERQEGPIIRLKPRLEARKQLSAGGKEDMTQGGAAGIV